jgi:hypothetical protein
MYIYAYIYIYIYIYIHIGGDNNMAKLMGKIAKGDMGIKGMPM